MIAKTLTLTRYPTAVLGSTLQPPKEQNCSLSLLPPHVSGAGMTFDDLCPPSRTKNFNQGIPNPHSKPRVVIISQAHPELLKPAVVPCLGRPHSHLPKCRLVQKNVLPAPHLLLSSANLRHSILAKASLHESQTVREFPLHK